MKQHPMFQYELEINEAVRKSDFKRVREIIRILVMLGSFDTEAGSEILSFKEED